MWKIQYGRAHPRQVALSALLLAVGLGLRWLTISRRHGTRSQRRLPKRLVLIRHGQSEGNATPKKAVYRSTPDHLIALTQRGKAEALQAGKLLKVLLSCQRPAGRAKIFCSPYVRARQTLEGVLESIPAGFLVGKTTFDELLREFDRGFFGQPFSAVEQFNEARNKEGISHYRFPGYDSLLDVNQRVAIFWSILRNFLQAGHLGREDTVVLVAHNGSLGQFLGRLLGWSTERTATTRLANGCLLVLERFEFQVDTPGRHDAALYAPTPATYRHLKDLAALGLDKVEHGEPEVGDAEFDKRHAAAARAAAFALLENLHPSSII